MMCARAGRPQLTYPARAMPDEVEPLHAALDASRCGSTTAMLALLAADGALPVAPAFVVTAAAIDALRHGAVGGDAAGDSARTTAAVAIKRAWESLDSPRRIVLHADPVGNDVTEGSAGGPPPPSFPSPPFPRPPFPKARRVAHAAHVVAAVLDAAGNRGAIAVRVSPWRAASALGRAYSEDPRAERLDALAVHAWSGDAPLPTQPPAEYLCTPHTPRPHVRLDPGAMACLTTAQLHAIAALVRAAEAALAEPIVVEWALIAGRVQTRTVAPLHAPLPWGMRPHHDRPTNGWSRANAAEVFPHPLTPLTWSLMADPLDAAFAGMYRRPSWTRGYHFVAMDQGYLFFNFGLIHHLNVERLGMPSRQLAESIGGPGWDDTLLGPQSGFRPLAALRHAPYILRMLRRQRRLLGAWPRQQRAVTELHERLSALDTDALSDARLLRELVLSGGRQRDFVRYYMEAQAAVFASYGMLSYLLERFLNDPALATALQQGIPGIQTAGTTLALWHLARRAAHHPATAARVHDTAPGRLLATLDGRPDTQWLADGLRAYLREHGHRSAGELELREPRWADDPLPLLRVFRAYVINTTGLSADDLGQRQHQRRGDAQRQIDRRLSAHLLDRILPLRRWAVRAAARRARDFTPLRENPKAVPLRLAAGQRRLLRTLAARAVDRGVLQNADDIFFLLWDELAPLVHRAEDSVTAGRLRSRVARRRRQYALWAVQTPPPVLHPSGPRNATGDGSIPSSTVNTQPSRRILHDLAASAGTATGRTRIARTIAEAQALIPGEVIVARVTDPGWTPLFPLAAAVVTEIGGALSHGAVVAREYGIPAVVNFAGVTDWAETGTLLRVDGSAGTVERLSGDD